jgi:hypothetical protein
VRFTGVLSSTVHSSSAGSGPVSCLSSDPRVPAEERLSRVGPLAAAPVPSAWSCVPCAQGPVCLPADATEALPSSLA